MPQYVVDKTVRALNQAGKSLRGSHVLVLGIAYKRDVDDMRESPSAVVMELLQDWGPLWPIRIQMFLFFQKCANTVLI